jgi:hypothetical protein
MVPILAWSWSEASDTSQISRDFLAMGHDKGAASALRSKKSPAEAGLVRIDIDLKQRTILHSALRVSGVKPAPLMTPGAPHSPGICPATDPSSFELSRSVIAKHQGAASSSPVAGAAGHCPAKNCHPPTLEFARRQ